MILDDYKIVFLKNPKTAGTSLKNHLFNIIPNIRSIDPSNDRLQHNLPPIIKKTRSAFTNAYYGDKKFIQPVSYANLEYYISNIDTAIQEYTSYVVVREPVDRFMSICRHVRDYGFLIRILFEDRLDEVSSDEDKSIHKSMMFTTQLFSTFSQKFQETFNAITIQEIGERILDFAFECNTEYSEYLDFVRIPQIYYYNDPKVNALDYAHLQKEISLVFEKHNIPYDSTLPKNNISSKLHQDSFSEEFINKIKKVYAEDVAFYAKISL